jgi:hypothetical protein
VTVCFTDLKYVKDRSSWVIGFEKVNFSVPELEITLS